MVAIFLARSGLKTKSAVAVARFSTTTPSAFVKRVTLFKIPKEEDIEETLKQYDILRQTALKDGEPYIVSNVARRVLNTSSPRSEGYTISSQSIFKTKEDHDFYDNECKAHLQLRTFTSKVRTGVMTIVTEGDWPEPEL